MSEAMKAALLEKAKREKERRAGAAIGQPVGKTSDGVTVMRTPDGSLVADHPKLGRFDNQEMIQRMMQGDDFQSSLGQRRGEVQSQIDRETISQAPVAARLQEASQGLPLVGEWIDEAAGRFDPQAAQDMRTMSDAMERENPYESAAWNIAGGVAGSLPVALKGAQVAMKAPTAARGVLRGLGMGMGAGAVEGGSAMAGRAELGERGGAAFTGALVGGGIGGAVGALAPLVGKAAGAAWGRIKKLDVRTIAEEFGISNDAARAVKGFLVNDNLDAAAARLAQKGDNAMLAEAGPGTRQLLDTSMSRGGKALATATPRVEARVQGAGQRWASVVDDVLGDAEGGIKGAAKGIAKRTAKARKAAYDYAYSQPTPMTGEAGRKIEKVLGRIDPKDLNAAMREANAEMRDAGLTNMNIMATIDDATGEVTFSQPLSVLQLDYLGRGLGNIVDEGTDKLTGKVTPAARRASSQAGALRDAMKESVDGYERALKLGGDKIKETNALVMGRKLLSETTTPEDVRIAMKGASEAERAAARKGLRENLEAVMGRARATIADLEAGNIDFDAGQNQVAEAVAAIRNLSSGNNMKKTRFVLGGDADRLFGELSKVGDALTLRAAVARNSATAIRQAGQEALQETFAPGTARRIAGEMGSPLDAIREGTRALAGTDAKTITSLTDEGLAEIADVLTRIKGGEARRALGIVRAAMKGQPIKDAQAELISRAISGGSAALGYQSGTRVLTQPR